MVQYPQNTQKKADYVSNVLGNLVSTIPMPTKVICDQGYEFMAKTKDMLENKYDIKQQVIVTQSSSLCNDERCSSDFTSNDQNT
jgi:hypothetical protein